MKWGVRRFQKKDGSLTSAGRRRYDDDFGGKNQNAKSAKPAKQYKIPEKKSNHRQDLEIKFQRKGMSPQEAEQAAARRIRAEKFVGTAAVTTVAAAAAYCAYKNYAVDKTISSNTEFQRIITLAEGQDVNPGRQYMAYHDKDKVKYKGLLGYQMRTNAGQENMFNPLGPKKEVYNLGVKAKQDLKVASRKRAQDTFEKLYKENEEFRKAFKGSVQEFKDAGAINEAHANSARKILSDADFDRKLKTRGYELFNIGLVNKSPDGEKAANIFYEELKKQGMNAIQDVNDRKYSGYNSKNPIITFDGAYEYSKKLLSDDEIKENYAKANKMLTNEALAKAAGQYALGYGGTMYAINKAATSAQVTKYRKEHPGTKMTSKEISDMLVKEQQRKQREAQEAYKKKQARKR